jgi:hypothetical protein
MLPARARLASRKALPSMNHSARAPRRLTPDIIFLTLATSLTLAWIAFLAWLVLRLVS